MAFDPKKAVQQVDDSFFTRQNEAVINNTIRSESKSIYHDENNESSVSDEMARELDNTRLINEFMDGLRPALLEKSQSIQSIDYQGSTKDGKPIIDILVNNNVTGVFLFKERLLQVIRQGQQKQLISVLPTKIFQALNNRGM